MNWTKDQLAEQIAAKSKSVNGQMLISIDALGSILADARFPKSEQKKWIGLLNHMKKLQKQVDESKPK